MTKVRYELKRMGVLDILRATIKRYREDSAFFFKVITIFFAPIMFLSGLHLLQMKLLSLLANFLILTTLALAVEALVITICSYYLKEQLDIDELLKRIKRKGVFSTLAAGLLVSLPVVGFELAAFALLKTGAIGMIFLVSIAPLLLWILINWSLFVQVIIIERKSPFDSLRRSTELIRQNWWRVFCVLMPFALVTVVPVWVAGGIAGWTTGISAIALALSVLTIAFTVPACAIGTTLLYFDLRIKKEGFDKKALVQDFQTDPERVAKIVADENYIRKRNALYIILGANLFLIVLKFILAKVSGNVAIAASVWMSVENFFLTSFVLLGVVLSVRDERISKKFSLIENVIAIVISIAILFIAGNMFVKMFIQMAHSAERMSGHSMSMGGGLKYIPAVTIAAIFGAGICYFMSQYKIYIGKNCKSASIEAAGRHCRLHVYMELAVIIGLIGAWIGLPKLNLLAAAFVLAYVIYTGFTILWRGYRGLTAGYPLEHSCHIERNYRLIGGFTVVIVALYSATGIYTVGWNEIGVVKRFGREIEGSIQPGLHYQLPWPIETVQKVKMDEVREFKSDRILLLAGDENIVNIQVGVHYSVNDASDNIFNTQEPHRLLKYNTQKAVRDIVGARKIIGESDNFRYLLTDGKSEVEEVATRSLQALMDKDRSGIKVLSLQILNLEPPEEVAEAFRDIASAMEEKETYIHEAEEYRNQIVTEAEGNAAAMVILAKGYKAAKINRATGEAEAYRKKLLEYQKARKITDLRLYLETMEKILPGVKKVFVDSNIRTETTDLWLISDKVNGKVIGFE